MSVITLNSDKICFPGLAGKSPKWAWSRPPVFYAFRAYREVTKMSVITLNSDKICFPSLSGNHENGAVHANWRQNLLTQFIGKSLKWAWSRKIATISAYPAYRKITKMSVIAQTGDKICFQGARTRSINGGVEFAHRYASAAKWPFLHFLRILTHFYSVFVASKNNGKTRAFWTVTQARGQPPIFGNFFRKKHTPPHRWLGAGWWVVGWWLVGWLLVAGYGSLVSIVCKYAIVCLGMLVCSLFLILFHINPLIMAPCTQCEQSRCRPFAIVHRGQ